MNDDRWRTAQAYERGFWSQVSKQTAPNDDPLNFYEWRSNRLVERLKDQGLGHIADESTASLEIGAGPVGVSAFFPAGDRVAVDPLENYYKKQPDLTKLRDPNVTHLSGVGEDLPCKSNLFDLVIIENCIDHVRNPYKVMREIDRVLRSDGVLYMTVNCRTRWGYLVHRLLSRLRIDAGHPHTFTMTRVQNDLMARHRFEILQLDYDSFLESWIGDLKGPDMKDRAKGMLGVSEYLVTLLARPQS